MRQNFLCRDKTWMISFTTQLWCRDRAGLAGSVATSVSPVHATECPMERPTRVTAHPTWDYACSVHALRKRHTCNGALCCALFGSLYMDTVHEHCSWDL